MDMSQPRKGDDLNINKGIELMLRRAKSKDPPLEPKGGFGLKKTITLLKRKFYFNVELRWERN
jgi:hypothetical protein